jgi:hypothetical protein
MTEEEIAIWFKTFDETKGKFEWFVVQYFKGYWEKLLEAREDRNYGTMVTILNDIWFWLPDNRFNIINNPPGWKEFLNLIEI